MTFKQSRWHFSGEVDQFCPEAHPYTTSNKYRSQWKRTHIGQ